MEITLDNIQTALRCEDVEGLLKLGAPQDEYSSEAQLIANALGDYNTIPTETDIVQVLESVWNKCFGPFSSDDLQKRIPAFEHIAKKLLKGNAV